MYATLESLTTPSAGEMQGPNAIDSAAHRAPNVSKLVATCEGTKVRIFDANNFLFQTRECQHRVTVRPIPDDFAVDLDTVVCSTCQTREENWFCLVCHEFFCGRFANRHMLQHHVDSGHCVSMSLLDLSVWCYACDMYLDHDVFPPLYAFFARMHRLKFREEPQNAIVQSDKQGPAEGEEAFLFWENLGPMGELMCSHTSGITQSSDHVQDINAQCATCAAMGVLPSAAASQENWVCLDCAGVFCGRYNSRHMLEHHQNTGHAVCLSLQDLSIWCYSCVQYVDHTFFPRTQAVFDHFSHLKFGDRGPAPPTSPPRARQAQHVPFASESAASLDGPVLQSAKVEAASQESFDPQFGGVDSIGLEAPSISDSGPSQY
ncbi:Ubiquitin carboxyl-terminal hydrolase 44 [Hondaea fermentalgiana]|uniref:Ubiquitin carboxyl-terminal hydrolase 44 n=1 Tax=Hondaea fermentalgiana TaxID=2315210 RepID=A0A2R5GFB9_9STRA|nr:Ubiquitin carboxyl-terminal hydrolase 44 [Hondaea fermentalgiana]|eukprot:GBG26941.1 Ubiquitin carboxyl-terminal hydrolase 44 [Hondaea fermentalgiana]